MYVGKKGEQKGRAEDTSIPNNSPLNEFYL